MLITVAGISIRGFSKGLHELIKLEKDSNSRDKMHRISKDHKKVTETKHYYKSEQSKTMLKQKEVILLFFYFQLFQFQ